MLMAAFNILIQRQKALHSSYPPCNLARTPKALSVRQSHLFNFARTHAQAATIAHAFCSEHLPFMSLAAFLLPEACQHRTYRRRIGIPQTLKRIPTSEDAQLAALALTTAHNTLTHEGRTPTATAARPAVVAQTDCTADTTSHVCFWRSGEGVQVPAASAQGCPGTSSTSGWR